jgi:hypothetical protein
MMRAALILAVILVGGCSQEKSESYYGAKPDNRQAVLVGCEAGKITGPDCARADAAESRAKTMNNIEAARAADRAASARDRANR